MPAEYNHHEEELSAMKTAVVLNSVVAIASLASGVRGNSLAAISEFAHDAGDALTHGIDYVGHNSENESRALLARRVSAVAIMGFAAAFAAKSGIEMFDLSDEAPEDYTVAIAGIAAAMNIYIHQRFSHTHSHENEGKLSLVASQVHAKVDAWVSPMLLAGIATSKYTNYANADDIAAFGGSLLTIAGNAGETVKAFRKRS